MTQEEVEACLNKGRMYLDEGKTKLAWEEFFKVDMGIYDPSIRSEAIVGEGVVYAIEGNFKAAIDKFRDALNMNPNHPNAFMLMEKAQKAYFSR